MMSEKTNECLSEILTYTQESLQFFSNGNKVEREKGVIRALLRCLGPQFSESDLQVGAQEPIDVSAKGASFQIMEILDEG